jgi:SAM-dependent methyltransferase
LNDSHDGRRHVTYVRGDAHHLDFPDATFDLAYTRYVLEHVADPRQVLREMRRVTRSGGRVAACENDVSLFKVDPRSTGTARLGSPPGCRMPSRSSRVRARDCKYGREWSDHHTMR